MCACVVLFSSFSVTFLIFLLLYYSLILSEFPPFINMLYVRVCVCVRLRQSKYMYLYHKLKHINFISFSTRYFSLSFLVFFLVTHSFPRCIPILPVARSHIRHWNPLNKVTVFLLLLNVALRTLSHMIKSDIKEINFFLYSFLF